MSTKLPPGTILKKRYEVVRHLKSGGYGAVYLATDAKFSTRPCVIKESLGQTQADIEQFEQEADILSTLSHPHLVRVTDRFVESGQSQYLVMDYIEGEDLEEILSRAPGGLPESDVLRWTEQILDALIYCHAFQPPVIHRDIKPSNIRIRQSDGKAILVDFGIAKIGDPKRPTHKGARGATDGYSPIEQYTFTGTGPYSDLYALGATLYHLLTGAEPPAAPAIQAGVQMLASPRTLRPALTVQVEHVILTAMQPRIQDRYQGAKEMRLDLQGNLPVALCPHCGAPVRRNSRYCPLCSLTLAVQPLSFPGAHVQVSTIDELIRACDLYWMEARALLHKGEIERWLGSINAKTLEQAAQQARTVAGNDQSVALETFLDIAGPTRTKPMLSVQTSALDFGDVKRGDQKTLNLVIANGGRGYLHGTAVADPSAWVAVTPVQFGCLAAAQQTLQVEVKTASLAGDEQGIAYRGQIVLQSNRGRQTVAVQMRVLDAPALKMSATAVDFGSVVYGVANPRTLEITNSGGGILQPRVKVVDEWARLLGASGKPIGQEQTLPDLAAGQSAQIHLDLDYSRVIRRGRYATRLLVEFLATRNLLATVQVSATVEPPYRLHPADAATGIASPADLWHWCDAHWMEAVNLLAAGRIEACLTFLGETKLAQAAAAARMVSDCDIGLEQLLRACGAPPPQKWGSNEADVLSALGYGILPKLVGRAPVVTLRIANQDRRGCLYGHVNGLTSWLTIPAPEFTCLPGEEVEVKLHADHHARRWRLGFKDALYEIVVA